MRSCAILIRLMFGVVVMMLTTHSAQAMVDVRSTDVDSVPVWFAQDQTLPVVHMVLTFEGAGSASDSDVLLGRAILAANLMSEGSGQLDALAFHQALEARAITLDISATKDDMVVNVHALRDELPEAMRLLRLALTEPRFDTDAVEQMRAQQLSMLRQASGSASYKAVRAWHKELFATHPYGRAVLGTEESVAALTAGDLEAYRERYITRANLQVAAAGALSKSELKDALEPLVEALPESFFPERDLPGATLNGGGKTLRIAHDSPQSVVVFGGAGIARADKKYYAAYLMNEVFGGGALTTRLMQQVRKKNGFVYSIGTELSSGDGADSFVGQFSTKNSTVDASIAAVKRTIAEVVEQGFSKRECQDIKREVIDGFALKLDSTSSIAQVIAMMMRYDLGEDYLEERAAYFDAVRCEDINHAAATLLTPESWLWVVVGGEPSAQEAAAPVASAPTLDPQR